MKLIVGLGNPGKEYEGTRHNVGFMAIDFYAKNQNIELKLNTSFKGMLGQINLAGSKAILLKPMTFMNLSGESIIAVMNFYKIDVSDILVIMDDLSLPIGKVRLRASGSSGGHNGLKSINNHIKTEEYKRIKIGIDRSNVIPVVDYVLSKFSKDDLISIAQATDKCLEIINEFIKDVPFQTIISTKN